MRSRSRPRLLRTLVNILLLVLLLAACGGDGAGDQPDAAPDPEPAPTADDTGDADTDGTDADTDTDDDVDDAAGEPETTELTIAASAMSAGLASTFVADHQGFFEAEGLDAEVVPFSGAPAALQGLITGAADVAVMGFASTLTLYGTPEQPVVIFESSATPSFEFFGREGIESWEELAEAGGTLGNSSIGGMDYQLAHFMARQDGVDPSRINFQAAGNPTERAQGLIAGQLDAVAAVGTSAELLRHEGYPQLARLRDYVERFPLEVYVVTQEFYDNNPNTVAALERADAAAAQWIIDNDDETVVEALSNYYTISDEDRPFHLSGMQIYRDGLGYDDYSLEGMELVTQFAIDEGNIDADDPRTVIESFIPDLRQ